MSELTKYIIKDRQIISDEWTVLRLDENQKPENVLIPEEKIIVPLAVWQTQRAALLKRDNVGVWIASSERAEALQDDVAHLKLIAIDFPRFSDGRGYSIATNLRRKLHYSGELRAIGDVLRDQLFFLQRVGFNAFSIPENRHIHDAIKGLNDFSETYQTSVDQTSPLFRRVNRTSLEVR